MQQVRVYENVYRAEADMDNWIEKGWRVHTCAMTSNRNSYHEYIHILVIYEKE